MAIPTLLRATGVLIAKNLRYLVLRRLLLIFLTALVCPIVIVTIISYGRDLFNPKQSLGTASPHAIKSLAEAFRVGSAAGRDRLYLVNSGFKGGDIDRLLDRFEEAALSQAGPDGHGMQIIRQEGIENLEQDCESNARGVSSCFGTVILNASPTEGDAGFWSYDLRADAALVKNYQTSLSSVDGAAQVYFMPVQMALQHLMVTIDDETPVANKLFPETLEFPFSWDYRDEYESSSNEHGEYYTLVINLLAIVYLIPMVAPCFHLTGFVAGERESGMAHLIDSMSVVRHSQLARQAANYLSFVVVYGPSWIVTAATMHTGLFTNASFGILLATQLLAGLALCSWALLAGSLFRKAQWSGIAAVIVAIVFGVLAQVTYKPSTAQVYALSALFTPTCYVNIIQALAILELSEEYPSLSRAVLMEDGSSVIPAALIGFFAMHIVLYCGLAVYAERLFHGTASAGRRVITGSEASEKLGEFAVRLEGFSKSYTSGIFSKKKKVLAVDNLDLSARRGQIVALLGANGSGKSTTLDSIGGLRKLGKGTITIDGNGGLGIAPQRNVLWDNLTVQEHLRIFTQLKTSDALNDQTNADLDRLIDSIGLAPKRHALAKTLSGGQKRKLQLGMMLTGGSAVCLVDEVSTGVDPLSRRNIWDILLAERGRRTIILTTHFLDEADMLADDIAILSKGKLQAQGSSAELKDTLGDGYRVSVPRISMKPELPTFDNDDDVEKHVAHDSCTFLTRSPETATMVISKLEHIEIRDYQVSSPTLEAVFLQLAKEIDDQAAFRAMQRLEAPVNEEGINEKLADDDDDMSEVDANPAPLDLHDGTRVGFFRQARILLMKRLLTLKRTWAPVLIAIALPITVAGLITRLGNKVPLNGCQLTKGDYVRYDSITSALGYEYTPLMIGPASKFSNQTFTRLIEPLWAAHLEDEMAWEWNWNSPQAIRLVDTYTEFGDVLEAERYSIMAGIWLGDDSTLPAIAWPASYPPTYAFGTLGVMNMMQTNESISSAVGSFIYEDEPTNPWPAQMIAYMCLALSFYPPLLALYQGSERRSRVRSMEYSNGVSPLALWSAYLSFDFSIVLLVSVIAGAIWSAVGGMKWFEPAYMIAVLFFYGTAAVMFAHLVSLATRSQLATWAVASVVQLVLCGAYFGGAVSIAASALPSEFDSRMMTLYFGVGILAPIVSIPRAMFVALNMYQSACDDKETTSHPGNLRYYGGPILYLAIQTLVYGILVVWIDGGFAGSFSQSLFSKKRSAQSDAEYTAVVPDVAAGADLDHGLRVQNVTKSFGSNTAVDNVSFGIQRGEIFALLGPNGAGKSTLISLISGGIKPSRTTPAGDLFVEDHSILTDLSAARLKLGVCPQFDALDLLTVKQHLSFYAQIRGVPNYEHDVTSVLGAVGLRPFANRMAHTLSGGNKRKLSLAIALMGNPAVLLLDEPSSGLDAASKRTMWQTLLHTSIGRSILLTTHSMEEADALAMRVGIIAGRMLAADTPAGLRGRYADILHVHLVCASAPRAPQEDTDRVLAWVRSTFPSADLDGATYHGQIRFAVRGADVLAVTSTAVVAASDNQHVQAGGGEGMVGQLLMLLERAKKDLGVAHYSVTPTTLDQVFLSIVRAHSGDEENQHQVTLSPMGKVGRVLWS